MKTFDEKISYQEEFNKSYLKALEYRLNSKKEKILLKYSKKHSDVEVECKKNALELGVKNKLNKTEAKLSHKVSKKYVHHKLVAKRNQNRIWEIDLVRGVIIFGMLIDHFIGNFWMVFPDIIKDFRSYSFFTKMYDFSSAYWGHPVRVTFRLLGVALLLILCGISAKFSKNNLKRGLLITGVGLLIDAGFAIYASSEYGGPADYVIIGAILCIGICLLIYTLFRFIIYKSCKEAWKWISLGLAIGILLSWQFVSMYNATNTSNWWFYFNNYAGCIPCIYNIKLVNGENFWRIILGLTYYGSDWLGLFPYLGYIFLGGFLGEVLYPDNKPLIKSSINEMLNRRSSFITVFGRNTIWFYVLHQPVFILLITVVALLCGCQLAF